MNISIAPGAKSASNRGKRGIFLDRYWRLAIERAARRQRHTPPGAPLWHFMTKPASVAYTEDGELALELGDPPLVLLSSDAALLPELYLELEAMRYGSQLCRMTDRQRQHQARIYTAGAYLADALEQLADGLPAFTAAWTVDDRHLSATSTPRTTCDRATDPCRAPMRAPYPRARVHNAARAGRTSPAAWRL